MSREKGDKLEKLVSKKLDVNRTTNSGARYNNADLANHDIVVECKYRDINRFKPEWKDIDKVRKQAINSGREWIYIQENQEGIFVTIDFEYFRELFDSKNNLDSINSQIF